MRSQTGYRFGNVDEGDCDCDCEASDCSIASLVVIFARPNDGREFWNMIVVRHQNLAATVACLDPALSQNKGGFNSTAF